MDILYRGIVHTATAARLWIQCTLENCTEDGGRYLAPVEVQRSMLQQRLLQLLSELWYLDFFFKQAAIGIGKCCQLFLQVFAALLLRSVQHFKQVAQGTAQVFGFIDNEKVMELVTTEDACILGIKTEYQTNTENIQPAQSFGRVVVILFQ